MAPLPVRRPSLRYPWHDYADPGAVFVTICTHPRQPLFGTVVDGQMRLSGPGELVRDRWQVIPERFPTVGIDAFVIMPDHLHGIVLTGTNPDVIDPAATVGAVVRWVKTSVLAGYRIGVVEQGWPRYQGSLWQRDYFDRILRSEAELANRRRYIEGNPGRWWERFGDGS